MNPERLRQIIQQGENLDVEFKGEKQRQLSDDDIVRLNALWQERSLTTAQASRLLQ